MSVVVYPVTGFFLRNVPSAPLKTSAETADRLERTGAFTRTKPRGAQPDPIDYEADADLDFYDNPRGDDHDKVVHNRENAVAVPIAAEPEAQPEE